MCLLGTSLFSICIY